MNLFRGARYLFEEEIKNELRYIYIHTHFTWGVYATLCSPSYTLNGSNGNNKG